jgi:hypothetical protein
MSWRPVEIERLASYLGDVHKAKLGIAAVKTVSQMVSQDKERTFWDLHWEKARHFFGFFSAHRKPTDLW